MQKRIGQARTLSVRNIPSNNVAIQTWPDLAGLAAAVIEPRIPANTDVKAKAESLEIHWSNP